VQIEILFDLDHTVKGVNKVVQVSQDRVPAVYLYFIEYQNGIKLITDIAKALEKDRISRKDATFALNRLHQDGTKILVCKLKIIVDE